MKNVLNIEALCAALQETREIIGPDASFTGAKKDAQYDVYNLFASQFTGRWTTLGGRQAQIFEFDEGDGALDIVFIAYNDEIDPFESRLRTMQIGRKKGDDAAAFDSWDTAADIAAAMEKLQNYED